MAENSRFYGSTTVDTRNYYASDIAAHSMTLSQHGVIRGMLNNFQVVQNGAGTMNVDVSTGWARVYGYLVTNDAAITKSISSNSSGNPRIDRVILRNAITGAKTITVEVLQGTPAGSPVPPTLTQTSTTWEVSLAQVYVANNETQILTADITDERNTTYCGYGLARRIRSSSLAAPTGAIDMVNQKISNVADAVAGSSDLLNKQKFDALNVNQMATGVVVPFPMSTIPTGWLPCDGGSYSTTTYAALFAIIGYTFGGSGGSFNVPLMKGLGVYGNGTLNTKGGEKTHVLTESEMPAHVHNPNGYAYDTQAKTSGGVGAGGEYICGSNTLPAGGGGAHENRPPFMALRWGIKT